MTPLDVLQFSLFIMLHLNSSFHHVCCAYHVRHFYLLLFFENRFHAKIVSIFLCIVRRKGAAAAAGAALTSRAEFMGFLY